MLVLSRKEGEKIVLPEVNITFTITKVQGNRVTVGIDAPSDVHIFRGEKHRANTVNATMPTDAALPDLRTKQKR